MRISDWSSDVCSSDLQLIDETTVDLQEVAGQRLSLEQVGHLRLDALVAAVDRGDGRGRRDRDQQRVAQAMGLDALAQAVPALTVLRHHVPCIELQLAAGRAGVFECRVPAALSGQFARGLQREVDRKSHRLNSSHYCAFRMPSYA